LQKIGARRGEGAAIPGEFDMAAFDQPVRHGDGELPGKMIIACAGAPQGLVARTHNQLRPRRIAGFIEGGDGHDAFQHLRHGPRRQKMVVVPALARHGEQARFRQTGQMRACGADHGALSLAFHVSALKVRPREGPVPK
jgi:hypothetical protein